MSSGSQKKAKSHTVRKLSAPIPPGEPSAKRLRPLSSLGRLPIIDLTKTSQRSVSTTQTSTKSARPKGKAKEETPVATMPDNVPIETYDQMWIDLHVPTTEETLAVHKRKVQDVRQWLLEALEGGPSGKLRKYRRILALTGPAGTGKTATIRILARELNVEILEWRNGIDDTFRRDSLSEDAHSDDDWMEYEGLSEKFRNFLTRAAKCHSVLGLGSTVGSTSTSTIRGDSKRRIVVLEDLPNILHLPTRDAFHAALEGVVNDYASLSSPIVVVISDAGLRGEGNIDDIGTSSWKGKSRDTVDIRTVLPQNLVRSPYVTQIEFNPIAPTLMRRALQHILACQFPAKTSLTPSKEVLDFIVESSNGDIRSAIMALQFATTSTSSIDGLDSRKGKGRTRKAAPSRALMEVVTRREQSLALFHLIGKLLYNKRKGDPPSSSASAKDKQRDKDFDTCLKDPLKLPSHLQHHDRKSSRVDVETLYADSPVDSGLLALYLHQNYTQYCDDLDQCSDVMDSLSWSDLGETDSWQGNPYRFHLISLGTLHSLPSPVTRRNQKNYKPEFFDVLKRSRDCEDGIRDTHQWIRKDEYGRAGGWTPSKVALELGAVVKARSQRRIDVKHHTPPPSSRLFSHLQFTKEGVGRLELANGDDFNPDIALLEDEYSHHTPQTPDDQRHPGSTPGGWLEDDDIEDYDF
ncbi:hypothetical protein QCA50_007204 [Cerrena zonata]|uniref:AAA+ ATPase domain-containing protein n=1 Tax=Cerrena zonata TaxID=2478898 RepID=A0AAW0GHK9_9APHY